ncbi:MAG: T9SS type A sorting domain-containing protein [Bacteroidota bacterium]
MKPLFIALLVLLCLPTYAQTIAPGGVAGAWQWWHSNSLNAQNHQWQMGENQLRFSESEGNRLNFWPSPNWQQLELPSSLELPANFTTSATIFVVYHPPLGEQEQVLWSWQMADQAPLVSTNKRLADLAERKYLNFIDQRPGIRLQTYEHAEGQSTSDQKKTFALGQLTTPASIPASRWSAPLAEFIIFPKVLAAKEQARVESYLALKFGTTLGISGKGADYLSSAGLVLWEAQKNEDYHYRVFGLGRDQGSNWEQGHSCAAEAPELLTVKISEAPQHNGIRNLNLPDQNFLLIGDNNKELDWQAHATESDWEILHRHWRAEVTGNLNDYPMDIQMDLGRWLGTDIDAYEYQIIALNGNANDFPWEEVETYPQTELLKGRFARFANITWPTGPQFHFTLARRLRANAKVHSTDLRVYPNPLQHQQSWQWQLRLEEQTSLTASLTNAKGQQYWERQYSHNTYFAAEEAPLMAGTYWLTLRTNTQTFTQKIVVQ